MSETASAYEAIAYPLRRDIIDLLFESPRTINEISNEFSISRQAIKKHLVILEEAKLLNIQTQGREKICTATLDPLLEINDWIKTYEKFWDNKLDNLQNFLENK